MLPTFRALLAGLLLAAVSPSILAQDPETTRLSASSLAPSGTLRVGINLGNPVLAALPAGASAPTGVSVDIATEAARRLGVRLQLTTLSSAGSTVAAMGRGELDLIFVAIDPERGRGITYSPPYVQIEGAYLVREGSRLRAIDEVDRPGVSIVVGKGSAYDLYLSREIRQASLVRAENSQTVVDLFMRSDNEVAAGVRQQLEADAKRHAGVRLLPGRFMVINQAVGVPNDRPHPQAISAFLGQLINDLKTTGFVAAALTRHGIEGAKVAE